MCLKHVWALLALVDSGLRETREEIGTGPSAHPGWLHVLQVDKARGSLVGRGTGRTQQGSLGSLCPFLLSSSSSCLCFPQLQLRGWHTQNEGDPLFLADPSTPTLPRRLSLQAERDKAPQGQRFRVKGMRSSSLVFCPASYSYLGSGYAISSGCFQEQNDSHYY